MNLTQEPGLAPAIESDSLTPMQPFEMLLARYKARVYEIYSSEIGRIGEVDTHTFLLAGNHEATL